MNVLTLAELARLAKLNLEPAVWDFIEGGAGEERTLTANRDAFDRVWLRPTVLAGNGTPQIDTAILGRRWAAPFGVAPLGYQTLAHPDGELATVRAAGEAGVPVVVSTFAGRTFEELAAAATAPLWLQVYCFRDRAITRDLVERAGRAGFEALMVTADTPYLGRRLRDERNGFTLPPTVRPANLPPGDYASPSAQARAQFDPALDWSVIDWLRSISDLPIMVKGVLTAADAVQAITAGADGIVVSNHGGRQLDGAPPTLSVLPEIASAVAGKCPVLLDGGVRRGADVLAALALGADAVLLGRPVLHGLAVGEQAGVAQVLDILRAELVDAMSLAGIAALDDAGPDLVQESEPRRRRAVLHRADLHASLSDPLMETMNFLNEIAMRYPEAISFAPGRPHDKFFSTEQIFDHIRRYLKHLENEGRTPDQIRSLMYQYGPTAGQIRELIADSLRADEGIDVPPESIVVTVGAQEAMLLVLRALISGPTDVLMVSSPCYVGISGAARLLDIEVVPVVERPDGLSPADVVDAIEVQLARGRRPKALYVIPDHSNPAGTTVRLPARRALLDIAARYDVLLIEDSPYRLVSPGTQLPTLKSLDVGRRVVHLGSFSKTIFPGARVGFVVADQQVVDADGHTGLFADELSKIKSMVTVNTSPLSQAAVAGALLAADGRVAALNAGPATHYGETMRLMLEYLDRRLPAARRDALGVSWNRPTGGFFLTASVPFLADNAALARSAEHFGVLWTPMSYFYPGGGGEHGIRLSTSYLTATEIEEGTSRLARFIESEIA
ncbi:aminotransferase class I/II-fold pyridoxal phosphate-dependent enzyme [Plantactinospora solaniradicis]|uniref:Aminotransferase class I/II-fold pyridoxal phosphate-dependent enzyme n=1 Tax=Plantactinospora solaniradicis TaxID=1723736 RepID=A0ABW1K5D4_9ACTN